MCNTKPDIFGSLISRSNNSYIQCSAKDVHWCMLFTSVHKWQWTF